MARCERCDAPVPAGASECPACGMPTAFMSPLEVLPPGAGAAEAEVVEPEIVGGFDPRSPGRGPTPGSPLQVGCALGPGLGCLGLPLAVVGAVLATSVLALAWLLRIGQAIGSGVEILARALGRGRPRGPGGP